MIFIWYSILVYCAIEVLSHPPKPIDCPVDSPKDQSWNKTAVDYYVNLVITETEKAQNYQHPKNNDFFLKRSDPASPHVDFQEYDFIMVGAGSSGSALAYHLSKIKHWHILLIEAGGNETDFSKIPLFVNNLQNSSLNWGYYTTPQKHACKIANDSRCTYPRGRVVGGSGAINGLMHVRGNKHDFDMWALQGNSGWSYDDVLPYFIKQESSQINGDLGFHGKHSLLNVEYGEPPSQFLNNFLEANEEVGRRIVDYNGAAQLGVSRTQLTTKYGRRESGGSVYLRRAECRKNLHILKQTLATKLLVDDSKRAYGVEFIRFGQKYTATAKKEVILSAGAINTPQLLLLSGIGPRKDLDQLGIKVVHNLPGVGRDLQDHVFCTQTFTTNVTIHKFSNKELAKMYLAGYGPYTKPDVSEAMAFVKLKTSKLATGVPDIQLGFAEAPAAENIPNSYSFSIFVVLLHPKSRGSVTLLSNSAFDFPAIDTNYLHEEEDRQVFYEGIEDTFKLLETEPFQRINATFVRPSLPECDQYEYRSREYWICYFKYFATTIFHPTSTAPMGTGSNAVVDSRLRVHGIKNLRIVDCSVMPNITSGNTNVPAFMIGYKASDIIKHDYLHSAWQK